MAEANGIVAGPLEQLPTTVTDVGDLEGARAIEPAIYLLIRLAYREGLGPRIALDLISEATQGAPSA